MAAVFPAQPDPMITTLRMETTMLAGAGGNSDVSSGDDQAQTAHTGGSLARERYRGRNRAAVLDVVLPPALNGRDRRADLVVARKQDVVHVLLYDGDCQRSRRGRAETVGDGIRWRNLDAPAGPERQPGVVRRFRLRA